MVVKYLNLTDNKIYTVQKESISTHTGFGWQNVGSTNMLVNGDNVYLMCTLDRRPNMWKKLD